MRRTLFDIAVIAVLAFVIGFIGVPASALVLLGGVFLWLCGFAAYNLWALNKAINDLARSSDDAGHKAR